MIDIFGLFSLTEDELFRNLFLFFAGAGQLCGMVLAYKNWNNPDIGTEDIVTYLFVYWALGLFVGAIAIPVIIVGLPIWLIDKLRSN